MQPTMLKSIHHSISTLACLALAGTLAACGGGGGGGGGGGTTTGNANAPTITFASVPANDTTSQTYAGASGGTFTNAATVKTNGFCTTTPGVTYSSIDTSTDSTTDKIAFSDVTPGELTYTAAGSYTITASTAATAGCAAADATYDLMVNKADAGLAFDKTTTTVPIGATITNLARLTGVGGDPTGVNGGTLDGISISYASDKTSIASVDANTGVVTGKLRSSTGAVTITATYAGSDNYKDVSDEYPLSVTLGAAELAINGSPIKKLIFSWQDVTDVVLYRLRENPDGDTSTDFAQVGDDVTAGSLGNKQSITHIVPLYARRIGAKYELQSCSSVNTADCVDGAAKTLTKAHLDAAIGYIKASNTGGGDQFGWNVSLSADGTTLAVGAYLEDSNARGVGNNQSEWSTMNNDNTGNAGAVYVFTRSTTTNDWTQDAYIKASNTGGGRGGSVDDGDEFGTSLSLSADGTTLAVGAYKEDSNAASINRDESNNDYYKSGAVYVFSRDASSVWTQQAYIKASITGTEDYFGASVSLSADGDTLAVGATGEDNDATGVSNTADEWDFSGHVYAAGSSGVVYVFTRTNSTWSQQAYIKASNTGSGDKFGTSLSLSADGDTLAVGAYKEDSNATGIDGTESSTPSADSGAVYVFSRTSGNWTQQAYIKASNTGSGDEFGASVSLDASGDTLAVGATGEASNATGVDGNQSNDSSGDSGAVYVFTRDATTNDWTQDAYIKASNTGSGDDFGSSVSLSKAGNTLAVGANQESSNAAGVYNSQSEWSTMDNDNTNNAGAVYVFSRDTSGDWSQQAYIKASNTGSGDDFGSSVSLDASGDTLAVGAYGEASDATGIDGDGQANNSAGTAGAVYLY